MMNPRQQAVVQTLLRDRPSVTGAFGEAFAPANIALCKYWGKRDTALNLPVTSSLSISLGELGTQTRIEPMAGGDDSLVLGRDAEPAPKGFTERACRYLDLFRPNPDFRFRVHTINHIPTEAGFASSASGFAALVLALDKLFDWKLGRTALSILARLGSGSACRSVYDGFVEWSAGTRPDGMDSHAQRIKAEWPGFCVGLLPVDTKPKSVGSRPGMERTTRTSPLYHAWPDTVKRDLATLRQAIEHREFSALGAAAEGNALAMHATMLAARPALLYWRAETIEAMHRVWAVRESGLPLWFTMDAGPNLKLLFEEEQLAAVRDAFPSVTRVFPFGGRP